MLCDMKHVITYTDLRKTEILCGTMKQVLPNTNQRLIFYVASWCMQYQTSTGEVDFLRGIMMNAIPNTGNQRG